MQACGVEKHENDSIENQDEIWPVEARLVLLYSTALQLQKKRIWGLSHLHPYLGMKGESRFEERVEESREKLKNQNRNDLFLSYR
jgi:hypothetical protein